MRGLITNDWDRDNLNFLINATPDVIAEWNAQADEDDIAYAQELLDAYAEELRLQAHDLLIEAKLAMMFIYPDARRVIDKIRISQYNLNNNKAHMKTNKELNTAHEAKQASKVRPASKEYNFKPLEDVIRSWVTGSN